jgi:tetratricopeptide (TPR) repeat protein
LDTSLIYQALEQPSLRKQIPLDELERIQAAYPYFTAAQVLLAKIYQENKDHRYADQLQQAALYAIDRKVLSAYMREEIAISPTDDHSLPEKISDEIIEVPEGIIPELITDVAEIAPEAVVEDSPTEEVQVEVSPEAIEEVLPEVTPELTDKKSEEIPSERSKIEMSNYDREILIEAVRSSIEMEVGEESEEEGPSTGSGTTRSTGSGTTHSTGSGTTHSTGSGTTRSTGSGTTHSTGSGTRESEKTEEIERIEAKDPAELTFGEMMMLKAARMGLSTSSGDDLSTNQNELRGENEDQDEDIRLNTNEERTEERGKNFDYLYKLHNGGLAPIDATNEKEKQKSIIDRFIKLEPKITPGKVSEYNTASNLAKESLEEDFSFATETMAKLFIAQGKFDKAKKVYRKLMELHPEKNVYFAAQLKNLNQNKKQ